MATTIPAGGHDGRIRAASTDSTVYNPDAQPAASLHKMPDVDMAHAASLRPSKLHGKPLLWMVNVVAGVAFILFGYDQGELDMPHTRDLQMLIMSQGSCQLS